MHRFCSYLFSVTLLGYMYIHSVKDYSDVHTKYSEIHVIKCLNHYLEFSGQAFELTEGILRPPTPSYCSTGPGQALFSTPEHQASRL